MRSLSSWGSLLNLVGIEQSMETFSHKTFLNFVIMTCPKVNIKLPTPGQPKTTQKIFFLFPIFKEIHLHLIVYLTKSLRKTRLP